MVARMGLRWSTLRCSVRKVGLVALDSVKEVMIAYPELKGDEYAAWTSVLERLMVPVAK